MRLSPVEFISLDVLQRRPSALNLIPVRRVFEESEHDIVPMNHSHKDGVSSAEMASSLSWTVKISSRLPELEIKTIMLIRMVSVMGLFSWGRETVPFIVSPLPGSKHLAL